MPDNIILREAVDNSLLTLSYEDELKELKPSYFEGRISWVITDEFINDNGVPLLVHLNLNLNKKKDISFIMSIASIFIGLTALVLFLNLYRKSGEIIKNSKGNKL